MPTPVQLKKLWLLSDTVLYPEAVAFMQKHVQESEPLPTSQVTGLFNATASEQWQKENGRFIPHPPKWLNGRLWEDELKPEVPKPAPMTDQERIHQMAQQRARLYAAAEREEP